MSRVARSCVRDVDDTLGVLAMKAQNDVALTTLAKRDEKLNVRLPAQLKLELAREAHAKGFRSVSDYALYLFVNRQR